MELASPYGYEGDEAWGAISRGEVPAIYRTRPTTDARWLGSEQRARAVERHRERLREAFDDAKHLRNRRGEWIDMPTPPPPARVDYAGEVGNRGHITRVEEGQAPVSALANLMGVRGEVPGEHRNRQGAEWDAFVADVKANGVRSPIFVTVDPGEKPKISEGNHRRDAAVEAGLTHVPVEVRYFGRSELAVGDWLR